MKYQKYCVIAGTVIGFGLPLWISSGTHATAGEASGYSLKWVPAPQITTADGSFKLKLRGRVLWDAARVEDDEGREDSSRSEFRAARIGLEGVAWRDFKYKIEVDFAGGDANLTGATVEYVGFKPFTVTAGHLKHPTSLEESMSSRFITFMERAAFTDAFGFGHRLGLQLGAGGDRWTAKVAILEGDPNTSDPKGYIMAGRATYSPSISDAVTVHLGASMFHRENAGADTTIRYRQRPHAHLARNRFIDTRNFSAESDSFYGLEAAALFGSFSLQSEYGWISANRVADANGVTGDDPTFEGGYISGSWFVTGGSRSYSPKKGVFGRPKISRSVLDGGWGAFEVGARLDFLDLTDQDIRGGKQTTAVLGSNWYLHPHVRLMANYAHSRIRGGVLGDATGDNEVDTVMFRAQVDW
ncbi:MAG: OprO/OprP family phosphate-selective porin [Sphingomonadales bacterium]